MKIRPLALALALTSAAVATVAPPAGACGTLSERDRVELLLDDHFAARNAHDRAAILALWTPAATVRSLNAIEPIDVAATRWVAAKEPVTFTIHSMQVSDASIDAIIEVVSNGNCLVEAIGATKTKNGWRLSGESSVPRCVGKR